MTWIIIWKFPKWFLVDAYKKESDYYYQKKSIKLGNDILIENERKSLLKTREENINKEILIKEEIKKTDPEIDWKKDFNEFSKLPLFSSFQNIIDSIYTHSGYISYSDFRMPKDILVYSDVNNLIEKISSNRISLTKKGKFFIKKFTK